jgi:hypothetical protein
MLLCTNFWRFLCGGCPSTLWRMAAIWGGCPQHMPAACLLDHNHVKCGLTGCVAALTACCCSLVLQVQDARLEIEKRVLRDLEAHVNKARAAAQEAAAAREEVLLAAVEELAGADVAAAVQKQLQEHEQSCLQQQQGKQERDDERQQQGEGVEDEGEGRDGAASAAG